MTFLKTDPNFSYIMLSMAADFYLVLYGYHAIAITYTVSGEKRPP